MPESLEKVRRLRAEVERQGVNAEIEIDGGIGLENAGRAVAAGADVLVAGSSAFRDGNVEENVAAFTACGNVGTAVVKLPDPTGP